MHRTPENQDVPESQGARHWIEKLQLREHPEGGFFTEVYRSEETIPAAALPERFAAPRSVSTSIYYLLRSGDFSAFHRIKSDELWHFYAGSPLRLHMLGAGDQRSVVLSGIGREGHYLQYAVPYGLWFAAEVMEPGSYALLGCTVAPGFDYADFELGSRAALCSEYPAHVELVTRLTRA